MIGHDELDSIVKNEFGMANMKVSDLEATPTEIMKIMKKYLQVILDHFQKQLDMNLMD